MTEAPLETFSDSAEAQSEIARKNMAWGWALFALFCVLFGGTVLIALAYLWLS